MQKFLERLGVILEVLNKINLDTRLDTLKTWDSLAMVSFLAMVDAEYEKNLDVEDIIAAQTVKDLFDLVQDPRCR